MLFLLAEYFLTGTKKDAKVGVENVLGGALLHLILYLWEALSTEQHPRDCISLGITTFGDEVEDS